ncbi:hypothetical protein PFLL34_04608 [Pseudomonas fluorescens]|uniref:hypothetical protein n=1 Tax=Pseudomonas fluorescens TaxID=294 RepID=UPI000762D672|nr:hypothetical protein [Pseudomonas fluorescens]KWV78083.1 hypothetical protein PFLL34_04608 [Pseudomonas fluorescens]
MNVTALAQSEFDNRLPPPVSESPLELARAEWLHNAAEQLVRFGCDVSFQRRMRPAQGVTLTQFALAVDKHANERLADCEVTTASLGYLLIAAERGHADKVAAAELLGPSDHPLGKLGEIGEGLLRPLVDDALIAQAEDNEP